MDGIMNDNQLTIVKEYEFDNPLIQRVDSLIDNSIRDCYDKYFNTFQYKCSYDIKFTNNTEIIISDKNLGLYELNKKLSIARQRGYIFNHINKLTIKFYTPLSKNNIHHYFKFQSPILVRQILKVISQHPESIKTFCNIFHNLEFVIV